MDKVEFKAPSSSGSNFRALSLSFPSLISERQKELFK